MEAIQSTRPRGASVALRGLDLIRARRPGSFLDATLKGVSNRGRRAALWLCWSLWWWLEELT